MPWQDKRSGSWRFRGLDASGKPRIGTSPSKALARAAEDKARERRFLIREQIVDAAQFGHVEHGRAKITSHIADYCQHLRDRKRSEKHVITVEMRLPKVMCTLGGLRYLSDATQSRVCRALALYSASGVSEQTARHAFTQAKAFLRWCVRNGRIATNPLAEMDPPAVTKQARPRRAATPDELRQIIAAAGRVGGGRWKAADRQVLMVLLCGAGLRAGDCRDLRSESFNLEAGVVKVEAGSSKNKVAAVQPLPPGAVDLLRPWLATKRAGRLVFPAWGQHTSVARMVYGCLKHAGISRQTAEGIIDGHSLRHSYGTALIAGGADIQTVRSLMRHDSIETTARYLHTDDDKRRAAVEGMARILPGGQ